jgi:hypothetical protein
MKKKLLFLSWFGGIVSWAATCGTATLSTYDASGFSCTEFNPSSAHQNVITFSNFTLAFTYIDSHGNFIVLDPSPLTDTEVQLTPVGDYGHTGFQIQFPFSIPAGVFEDAWIGYTAYEPYIGNPDLDQFGSELAISGPSPQGLGEIGEWYCVGSPFNGTIVNLYNVRSSCSSGIGDLVVFGNPGAVVPPQVGGNPSLNWSTSYISDIEFIGGTSGATGQVSFVEKFTHDSSLPEPSSWSMALLGCMLLGLGFTISSRRLRQ